MHHITSKLCNQLRISLFLVVVTLALTSVQAQVLNISPNTDLSVCPAVDITYSLTGYTTNCPSSQFSYDWTVGVGQMTSDDFLPTLKVKWNSTNSITLIEVDVTSDNEDCLGDDLGQNIYIKNLEGKSTNLNYPSSGIPYIANFAQTKFLSTERVEYNNPGPSDPDDQKEVDRYQWSGNPSGWTITSLNNTEFQDVSINIPATEIPSVSICVKGIGHCSSMETPTDCVPFYPYVPSPCETSGIQGDIEIQCNDVNPRTYSCAMVNGATQYIWTIPTGWSAPNFTTTTNSIVVTPNGINGGTITVKAKAIMLESETCSKAVEIKTVVNGQNVGIQGPIPNPVCTSGVLTLSNFPANSPISWNIISNFCQPSNGTGATASFIITQPNLNGDPPITFTIDPPSGCQAPPFKITRNFHFGAPTMTKPRLNGVDVQPWQSLSVCPGSHYVQVTPLGFGT